MHRQNLLLLLELEERFDMKKETTKQRETRKKRAEKQKKLLGYVSLKNRKSPEQIELAMMASCGNESLVCQLLKCTHWEFGTLIQSDSELGKKWREIRKMLVNRAEDVMAELMGSKSEQIRFQVAKYILDRRGKDLGYCMPGAQVTVETKPDGNTSINAIFGIE